MKKFIHFSHYVQYFWPRATLKGPKGSFFVVLLLFVVLGVETRIKSGTKIVQGNKNVQANKKCAKGTKNVLLSQNKDRKGHMRVAHYGIELLWLRCMALYGLVWRCVASYGLVDWCFSRPSPCVSSFHLTCLVWPSVFFYGLFMVSYGILWSFMAIYCRLIYCLFSRS